MLTYFPKTKLLYFFVVLFLLQLFSEVTTDVTNVTSHKNYHLIDLGDICGQTISTRIIGGQDAHIGQFPWIVRLGAHQRRLFMSGRPRIDYSCGGAIINEWYVLSAAHCWDPLPRTRVLIGEFNTKTDPDCEEELCAPPTISIRVDKKICHPGFNTDLHLHDICLVRLKERIIFNDFVHPVCLPIGENHQRNLENETGTAAGWGWGEKNVGSTILQTLQLKFLPIEVCQKRYGKQKGLSGGIQDSQLCTGGELGEDTCQGDSGGPVVKALVDEGLPRYYLVGIVSFGNTECGSSNLPSVNTRVSKYITWILDNIEE